MLLQIQICVPPDLLKDDQHFKHKLHLLEEGVHQCAWLVAAFQFSFCKN